MNLDVARWPGAEARPLQQAMTIMDLLSVLYRRRRIIQSFMLIGLAVALALRAHKTTEYAATAFVMISPGNLNLIGNAQAVSQGIVVNQDTLETQLQVIRSPDHIERVMSSLQLFDDPAFAPVAEDGEPGWLDRLVGLAAPWLDSATQLARSWLPQAWWPQGWWPWQVGTAEAGAPVAAALPAMLASEEPVSQLPQASAIQATATQTTASQVATARPAAADAPQGAPKNLSRERAIAAFTRHYEVSQVGHSYVIAVTFTAADPAQAADIANAAATLFVAGQQKDKLAASQRVTDFLSSRLIKLRDEVERAERAVVNYKRQNGIVEAQGSSLADQDLSNLSRELIVAKLDLAAKQAKYDQAHKLDDRRGSLDSISEVILNPLIIDLRQQEASINREEATLRASYGDKHPKIQDLVAERGRLEKRIGQEVERIVASLRNDLDVTANRVATIQDQLDQVAAVNSKRHEMTIELNQLEREAQTSRQLYELFLQRFNETREQENVIMPDAKVISQAMVPTSPKTPSMLVFGLVGFVVSGLAGCVCALLRDRLSTSMLCREDVERFLKLPTVAVVPKLRSRERPHTHLLSNSFSPFSDAISAAHTMLAAGEGGTPRSILLTSSIPEEGKTTMAVSLACFAAMSGVRTLLIDCDLRRPGVAGKLNICPTTGLTDYLCDGAPADDLVITEAQGGFDCILTERLRRNPTVPLSSQRMRDLMRWASARYDLILVDAPPLLGVPDAVIVASLVQQVLFISKWKTCTSSTILNALKQLGEARAKIVGVVLTQVNVNQYAHYGYNDGSFRYGQYKPAKLSKPSPLPSGRQIAH